MALDWRNHLAFDLTRVGGERLAKTALALRLDLRARRRLEILAESGVTDVARDTPLAEVWTLPKQCRIPKGTPQKCSNFDVIVKNPCGR